MESSNDRAFLDLVRPFASLSAADLPLVGGKGANLGELTRAGLPVPPGFCVTTQAFRAWLDAAPDVRGAVYARLDALPAADVEAAREAGAWVREALGAVAMPGEVAAAVVVAWQALEGVAPDGNAFPAPSHAYAVRSSATAEDLPTASFAGQQDTYLNIRGEAALLAAVKDCWISLFTDRAILYRAQNGFDHRQVSLSVVVQRMVFPQVSGILFTADPISGHRQIASIDASYGLGEALVGGLVSADLYRVDKRTGRLIERTVSDKLVMIRPLPDGGTVQETVPEHLRKAPALTDVQAEALAAVGSRVEDHFGKPQDIEWGLDDGRFYVLQARPITALYPLPDPLPTDDALHLYMSFGHPQMMTRAMPLLATSVLQTAIPFGGRVPPHDYGRYPVVAGHRVYIDLTELLVIGEMQKLLPRVLTVAEVLIANGVADVVGRAEFQSRLALAPERLTKRALFGVFAPLLLKAQKRLWVDPPRETAAAAAARMEELLAAHRRRVGAAAAGGPRLRAARQMLIEGFAPALSTFFPAFAGGMLARLLLLRMAGGWAPSADLEAVFAGLEGNVTTEMDLAVGDLADTLRPWPALKEALKDYLSAGDVDAKVEAPDSHRTRLDTAHFMTLPGGPDFVSALQAFLDRYGMRCPGEIDVTQPRWYEDPRPLLQVVLAGASTEAAPGAHRARYVGLTAEGEAAGRRLIAAAGQGLLGPLRAPIVARLVAAVRGLMPLREHPKFYLIRLVDLAKRAALEAGGQLVAAGRLDAAQDVFHFELDELAAAFGATADAGVLSRDRTNFRLPDDLRPLVAQRRTALAVSANLEPPRVITSDGEALTGVRVRTDLPPGTLAGTAASAGVVEGIAHVIHDPARERLEEGEILIAPFTDPGWTPLFIHAAGLVMEVGGLMTHGSVVAREYRIPAVVCVPDATKRIHTGDRVRVDGSNGIVEVLEPARTHTA